LSPLKLENSGDILDELTLHLQNKNPQSELGLTPDTIDFVNTVLAIYRAGQKLFQAQVPTSEDWAVLIVVISNDTIGRATVTKNIVEVTGRAFGTVRAALSRFEKLGYIESQQRIGRSELYVPTEKFKKALEASAAEFKIPFERSK